MEEIGKILTSVGLDSKIHSQNDMWLDKFYRFTLDKHVLDFFNEIDNKKSLSMYRLFKRSSFRENYMFGVNDFESTRLKFLARSECMGIQENLHKWKIAPSGTCVLCKNGIENISHFLLICPAFNEIRFKIWHDLEKKLIDSGNLHIWEHFSGSSVTTKLSFLLGDAAYGQGIEIADVFDGACKRYLLQSWSLRKSLVDGT